MLSIGSFTNIYNCMLLHIRKILLWDTYMMSFKRSNRNNDVMKQLCTQISLHQGYIYLYSYLLWIEEQYKCFYRFKLDQQFIYNLWQQYVLYIQ